MGGTYRQSVRLAVTPTDVPHGVPIMTLRLGKKVFNIVFSTPVARRVPITVRLEHTCIKRILRLRGFHLQAQPRPAGTCDMESLKAGLVAALNACTHLLLADIARLGNTSIVVP